VKVKSQMLDFQTELQRVDDKTDATEQHWEFRTILFANSCTHQPALAVIQDARYLQQHV